MYNSEIKHKKMYYQGLKFHISNPKGDSDIHVSLQELKDIKDHHMSSDVEVCYLISGDIFDVFDV